MIDKLQNTISYLIEKYIRILKENGEPNEAYKYLAINTFQQNWDLDSEDFYQMFRNSFGKVANLLYQTSRGFIEKSAELFPEETRAMFRNLYDESVEVSKRITAFQTESDNLLLKLQQALNRTNIKAQQDERTISVYLAFRFPEKYTLYKADYYKNFCEELQIKDKKAGNRFLHLQELADEIIRKGLLEDEKLMNTYRKFYPKPDWNDAYLIIQNIWYVTFKEDFEELDLPDLLKKFDKQQLEEYYDFLDSVIEKFGFQEDDKRLVFNADKSKIVFTIGQRYIWNTGTFGKDDYKFRAISEEPIGNSYVNFDGNPTAYLCKLSDISQVLKQQQFIFNAIEKELNRTQISGYFKYNKKELEKMAFDVDFRKEILNQLESQINTDELMKKTNLISNIPLNQILFGAPGTGKTYHTKKIAVEIINGKKERTRKEINEEFETLTNAKQIVFTTFHQSLSYEDFIEGIKPETTEGKITYEIKDGIFKRLCQSANPKNTISFENAYEKLQQRLVETEIIEIKTPTGRTFSIALNKNGNLSLMTGNKREKQGVLTKEKLLHQLNGREVFIGWDGYFKGVINYLKEEFNFNPEAEENNKNYVLIIDEINRGNVSAIFGELITLLEEDKRKGNPEQTEVILPYSGDRFSVPNNLYIIGTMNTADRSVEALDTALRRRFSFVEMQPNPEILSEEEYKEMNLIQLLKTMNQRIEVLVDKDHQIGHSYFIGIQSLEDLKKIFRDKIIPLLEEYFYGDFGKIGLVLGGKLVYQEKNKAIFPKNFTYENDFLEDKKIYRFVPFENWDVETFRSIYED